MATYIALLRAVNLGSHNKVSMADLKDLLVDLGMSNPQSVVQSGNLVFESTARPTAALEKLLETSASKQLGLDTPFYVPYRGRVAAGDRRQSVPEGSEARSRPHGTDGPAGGAAARGGQGVAGCD